MPRVARTVNIQLADLFQLLSYYWSTVNSDVGELGSQTFEETVAKIGDRSQLKVTPEELESLVYHTKQAIFEKLKPVYAPRKQKNYYKLMRRLASEIPQLFKTLPSGEIVFIDFEDRTYDGK